MVDRHRLLVVYRWEFEGEGVGFGFGIYDGSFGE
jgi:hypothetical protein